MSQTAPPPPSNEDHGHKGPDGEGPDGGVIEICRYVADICGQLSTMTKSAKLLMLSYLLSMAKLEAERFVRGRATGK